MFLKNRIQYACTARATSNFDVFGFIGEAVYIATNVIVKSPNYLRIWRENNTAYRGQDVYPFLHCIQCVESVDSGLYFWTTTENCLEENVFLLKVTGMKYKIISL